MLFIVQSVEEPLAVRGLYSSMREGTFREIFVKREYSISTMSHGSVEMTGCLFRNAVLSCAMHEVFIQSSCILSEIWFIKIPFNDGWLNGE